MKRTLNFHWRRAAAGSAVVLALLMGGLMRTGSAQ